MMGSDGFWDVSHLGNDHPMHSRSDIDLETTFKRLVSDSFDRARAYRADYFRNGLPSWDDYSILLCKIDAKSVKTSMPTYAEIVSKSRYKSNVTKACQRSRRRHLNKRCRDKCNWKNKRPRVVSKVITH